MPIIAPCRPTLRVFVCVCVGRGEDLSPDGGGNGADDDDDEESCFDSRLRLPSVETHGGGEEEGATNAFRGYFCFFAPSTCSQTSE